MSVRKTKQRDLFRGLGEMLVDLLGELVQMKREGRFEGCQPDGVYAEEEAVT
jgi:hypothetical protein